MLSLTAIALVGLSEAPLTTTRTPCQRCCDPGGDCSAAFKGMPGKCCGTSAGGQAFCCPGTIGGAKCYGCAGGTYRCFTGTTTRNICGATPSHHPHHSAEWMRYHGGDPSRMYRAYDDDRTTTGMMVLIAVGAVVTILFCVRRQNDVID